MKKWERRNIVQPDIEKQSEVLLYLAICTRPDILFAVSKVSRKS